MTRRSAKLLGSRREIEGQPLPLERGGEGIADPDVDSDGRARADLGRGAWRAARHGEVFDLAGVPGRRAAARADLRHVAGQAVPDLISALHKSVRGSDPRDAALFYLARCSMPARTRSICMRGTWCGCVRGSRHGRPTGAGASASPTRDTYEHLGTPEGKLTLAGACVSLATAPKIRGRL